MVTHQRVEDPFEGWSQDGNIYWHHEPFEFVEYGVGDIGQLEKLRRLFWVRLRLRNAGRQQTLFVATAHYTWYGNEQERTEGLNPRIDQARKTVETLDKLVPESEPLLFTGDLNDFALPIQVLHRAGLTNSFWALGTMPSPTWPAPVIDLTAKNLTTLLASTIVGRIGIDQYTNTCHSRPSHQNNPISSRVK